MAITPRASSAAQNTPPPVDTQSPFEMTLGVTSVAEDLAIVPVGKRGRQIDIINEGPGDVAVKFDATATPAHTLLREGDSVSWANLNIVTKVSFINITAAALPTLRGVLMSGPVS